MNQPPTSPPSHPADAPEPDARDEQHAASDEHDTRTNRSPAPESARGATPNDAPEPEAVRPEESTPPSPRPSGMPPPLPTFGAPQSPPRRAQPTPRPPEQYGQPSPPAPEQPAYPPRIPAPQPAPPGGMTEPPRPYEGGRYVPPPPMPPSGPSIPAREWTAAPTAPAVQPVAPVAQRSNPLNTALLGLIAALLLALAVFQGINTFRPKSAQPTGVQQVQVQQRVLKKETADEVKDTIDKAQTALNQFNQQAQQAYASATTDAQRQAVLLQLSLFMQQIIAQQNNDLLLIYQDLNT